VKRIIFTPPARADVRRIDRDTAMRILTALDRFAAPARATSRSSKATPANCACASATTASASSKTRPGILYIHAVLHRSEAYR
jgi:hypothetical protein